MELISKSLKETEDFAKRVLDFLLQNKENINKRATSLALFGNLGSGKTAFSQMLGKLLGVTESIQSPTFLIQKSYITKNKIFKNFIHIDAYRIEDPLEIIKLGFTDLFVDKNTLIVIEWPENLKTILPKDAIEINFEFIDENTRKILFDEKILKI